MKHKQRCEWPADNDLMLKYHDEEWGTPVHDGDGHHGIRTDESALQ